MRVSSIWPSIWKTPIIWIPYGLDKVSFYQVSKVRPTTGNKMASRPSNLSSENVNIAKESSQSTYTPHNLSNITPLSVNSTLSQRKTAICALINAKTNLKLLHSTPTIQATTIRNSFVII
jgi:hypothetical protein